MRCWRLIRQPFAANPLSGEGAARAGNRWNSRGVRVAYSSTSRPLAVLEMLVHVSRHTIPPDTVLIPLEVPDELIAELHDPPDGWDNYPPHAESRATGDQWVRSQTSLALLVPSAVIREERNLLINPTHSDFSRIKLLPIEKNALDPRLFG